MAELNLAFLTPAYYGEFSLSLEKALRDWSLFITWGEGAEDFGLNKVKFSRSTR